MSRIGKRILAIPADVTVTVTNTKVEVKGKLGTLTQEFSPLISVSVENNSVSTARANEEKHTKQLHGTTNSIIENMLVGVSQGYKKEIEIKGVGFKAAVKGDKLEVQAGYSHPVLLDIIAGVKVEVAKNTEVTVTGISNQAVGQMAAQIRDVRRPSPYTGKGIMYKGEVIRRKEGKAASK